MILSTLLRRCSRFSVMRTGNDAWRSLSCITIVRLWLVWCENLSQFQPLINSFQAFMRNKLSDFDKRSASSSGL